VIYFTVFGKTGQICQIHFSEMDFGMVLACKR